MATNKEPDEDETEAAREFAGNRRRGKAPAPVDPAAARSNAAAAALERAAAGSTGAGDFPRRLFPANSRAASVSSSSGSLFVAM